MACPEEVAFKMGFITADDVRRIAAGMRGNDYGHYLEQMIEEETARR